MTWQQRIINRIKIIIAMVDFHRYTCHYIEHILDYKYRFYRSLLFTITTEALYKILISFPSCWPNTHYAISYFLRLCKITSFVRAFSFYCCCCSCCYPEWENKEKHFDIFLLLLASAIKFNENYTCFW